MGSSEQTSTASVDVVHSTRNWWVLVERKRRARSSIGTRSTRIIGLLLLVPIHGLLLLHLTEC